jgi:hypothetical protein
MISSNVFEIRERILIEMLKEIIATLLHVTTACIHVSIQIGI